jgi:SAM-dependent MidA family methyltransferase
MGGLMDPSPGIRRTLPADLSTIGQDEALAARIRDEIARDGPMPFARFMELALYDPGGGYYRSATVRPGRAGDFITAPELHPIFGATLSTLLVEVWDRLDRPVPFTIREYGAGTGALAVAMLEALRAAGEPVMEAIAYEAIDVDPRRVSAFAERLAGAGFAAQVRDGSAEPVTGIVLANEVLDALPVHRVRQRGDDLRELAVATDAAGGLIEVEIDPTTPALAARLADESVELRDGQTAEIALAVDDWVAEAAAGLGRGLALFIDYAYPATELYDPVRRRDGTLRAYVGQQVHDDPYRHIGRQDLTAHVDVTAVQRAAERAGLTTVGVTTQAEALMGLGIEDRLRAIQTDPSTSMEAYLAVRSSLLRLLDPAAMGRFRFMAFGRSLPDDPPLRAFAFRLGSR